MAKTEEKKESRHDQRVSLQNFKNSEEGRNQLSELYANRSKLIKQAQQPIKKDQKNEGRK